MVVGVQAALYVIFSKTSTRLIFNRREPYWVNEVFLYYLEDKGSPDGKPYIPKLIGLIVMSLSMPVPRFAETLFNAA